MIKSLAIFTLGIAVGIVIDQYNQPEHFATITFRDNAIIKNIDAICVQFVAEKSNNVLIENVSTTFNKNCKDRYAIRILD